MGKYDFDKVIERRGTSSLKFDFGQQRMGRTDLLPLWVADMDFALPDEILCDIKKRVDHGIFGYTDPDEEYNDAVKKWFKERHGLDIKKEWNTVVPGVVYSIALAIKAFTYEDDSVIIQEPVYYPFKETILLNRRNCINNQLVYKDGRYEIDFEDFEKKIKENNVKLFLLCSPHNPVGRVWTEEELKRLGDICLENDVAIFSDEIHSDFIYPGYKHISFLELGDKYQEKLVIGTSPSKTFNIAGVQVANILIPDKKTRDEFRWQNDAAGYSQPNAIGLTTTISCYNKGSDWVDELKEYLKGNLDFLRDYLRENIPEVKLIEPEGTYLIWLDFSEVTDDYKDLKHLIVDEAKLWLDAGIIFGKETALFERINIASPRVVIKTALDNLSKAVKDRKANK
ncbi:MalY/PatB family protein [Butyrivibrio sp. WCE2006]|uniref:MalY/PatB family protein n=1 Tax=Butyrivibrio sp. WCE2006 TaxID=1410611 RepID=UPI0005D23E01|nr:MalY/PatB family protein [Butyrivibrio sp. WCE2006]